MRVLAGRGKKKRKKFRRIWKSSGRRTSGGKTSRRRRTNKRGTRIKKDGESLTSGEYAIYSIGINPKSRGLSGGGR